MPIPDQTQSQYINGIPAAGLAPPLINRLATGVAIHYVQPGSGTHLHLTIGNVRADLSPVVISVLVPDAARPAGKYEQTNVPYDDQTFLQGSWHFGSDG